MFKKLFGAFLAFAIIFAISGCGASDDIQEDIQSEESENMDVVTGGWELYDNEANVLPDDVQAAFDKALETFTGSELKPVAYIASQAVAGTNHMILCEAATTTEQPEISYQMVIVYADLEGNAELTQVKEFDLTAYVEGESTDISAEELAGGWETAEVKSFVSLPQNVKAVFDKAVENLAGNELEPMALLGTQVVAGTNYAFLCFSTLQTEDPIAGIQVVTVYEDLDGNAEITNICTLDPADFNK
ncbi:MAG: hypothetical protein IKE52_06225 [Mogibacterium sp.]|nr:hypothetical protein [Mogibacterium sp.]